MIHAYGEFSEDHSAAGELAAFEQELGSLMPASSLDVDRLLFEAGAAHERKQHPRGNRYLASLRYAGVAVAASVLTMLSLSLSNTDTRRDQQTSPMLAGDAEQPTNHDHETVDDNVRLLDSVVLRPKPSPAPEKPFKPIEVRRVSIRSTLGTVGNPRSDFEWGNDSGNLKAADSADLPTDPLPILKPPTNLQWQRELFNS